jgi:hypothetical protein
MNIEQIQTKTQVAPTPNEGARTYEPIRTRRTQPQQERISDAQVKKVFRASWEANKEAYMSLKDR